MDEGLLDDDGDVDVDYAELPPSLEIEEVIVLYRHLLAHLGLRTLEQCLGEGAHGAVFEVARPAGPIALKLTTDADEAIASAHLVKNPCDHVVRIRRVAGLPDTVTQPDFAQWFVVERELLELPSERDKKILNAIWNVYEDHDFLTVPTSRRMLDRWRDVLRGFVSPTDLKRAVWILRDAGRGARELGALGLEWSDLHDENLMRRPGARTHYVIADPGPGVMTGWREDRPIRIPAFRAGQVPRLRSEAPASVAQQVTG